MNEFVSMNDCYNLIEARDCDCERTTSMGTLCMMTSRGLEVNDRYHRHLRPRAKEVEVSIRIDRLQFVEFAIINIPTVIFESLVEMFDH